MRRTRSDVMCVFPLVPLAARALGVACVALLGCGGLAEDGRGTTPELSSVRAGDQRAARPQEPQEPQEPQRAVDTQHAEEQSPRSEAGGVRVGEECGGLHSDGEGVAVGTVELRKDPHCGAASWCLLRALDVGDCAHSGSVAAGGCSSDELDWVPVPPPRSAVPAWQENTCTCRCDGEAALAYCACPQGMRCAPLVPSAGANAAASEYVGAYCVY